MVNRPKSNKVAGFLKSADPQSLKSADPQSLKSADPQSLKSAESKEFKQSLSPTALNSDTALKRLKPQGSILTTKPDISDPQALKTKGLGVYQPLDPLRRFSSRSCSTWSDIWRLVPKSPLAEAFLKPFNKKAAMPGSSFSSPSPSLKPFFLSTFKFSFLVLVIFFIFTYDSSPFLWFLKQKLTGGAICPDPYGVCEEYNSLPDSEPQSSSKDTPTWKFKRSIEPSRSKFEV